MNDPKIIFPILGYFKNYQYLNTHLSSPGANLLFRIANLLRDE
jgi:hypothetical protein